MASDRTPLDDELELLRRWQDGDDRSGSVLFGRYFRSIRRFFESKTSHGVEDLVQETFLAAQRGRDRIESGSFRNYLFGTACNVLRSYLRQRHTAALDSGANSVAALDPSVSAMIAADDQQNILRVALQRIPIDYQIVFELRFWEGLTGPAIAKVLGIPEGSVRTKLRRGLRRLEEEIAKVEASPALLEMTMRDFSRWKDDIRSLLDDADHEDVEGVDEIDWLTREPARPRKKH